MSWKILLEKSNTSSKPKENVGKPKVPEKSKRKVVPKAQQKSKGKAAPKAQQKSKYIFAVLNGVADIICSTASSLRSLSRFQFLQQEEFFSYYRILQSEFEVLTDALVYTTHGR